MPVRQSRLSGPDVFSITIYLKILKSRKNSEALFINHVTSYSTSEGDVSLAGFKSMFIYAYKPVMVNEGEEKGWPFVFYTNLTSAS